MLKFCPFVILIVLTACADPEDHKVEKDPWSLNTPLFVSEAQGLRFLLKDSPKMKLEQLHSSDFLYFTEAMTDNLRIHIESQCRNQNQTSQHQVKMKLPKQITLHELLPPKARINGPWICGFQFTAEHPDGSQHYFELKAQPIKDDFPARIQISSSPIFLNRAYEYFVTNEGIGNVSIHCGNNEFNTNLIKEVLNFSELIPKTQLKGATTCRAIETEKAGRSIGISNEFQLVVEEPKIEITEDRPARRTYDLPTQSPKEVLTWSILNKSTKTYFVAVDKTLAPQKLSVVHHYNRKWLGAGLLSPVKWNRKGAHEKAESLVYELQPKALLNLKLETLGKWDCGYFEHGFYLQPNETPIELKVLSERATPTQANTLLNVDLSFYQEKWVGLTRAVYKGRLGPTDEHGALPVKYTLSPVKKCRKL